MSWLPHVSLPRHTSELGQRLPDVAGGPGVLLLGTVRQRREGSEAAREELLGRRVHGHAFAIGGWDGERDHDGGHAGRTAAQEGYSSRSARCRSPAAS